MTNREEWLSAKIAYINGLKSPSEQQRLLVLLAEKKNRTTTDEKTLSALIRAEKTAEKAAAAKARVTAIIAAERKAAARAERKARDHELYKAAGLMIVAGLVDSKTGKPKFSAAELVGALAGIATIQNGRNGKNAGKSYSPKTVRKSLRSRSGSLVLPRSFARYARSLRLRRAQPPLTHRR